MKEINQAIYDEVFKIPLAIGYSTYNYLPDASSYPFVYLGEQFGVPIQVKSPGSLVGSSVVTLHIYGAKEKRRQVTDMLSAITLKAKRIARADVYSVAFASDKPQIIQDNSTSTMLWHGILELEFNYLN